MAKYEAVYFVGDKPSPSQFFQNEESRHIFGLVCSPSLRKELFEISCNFILQNFKKITPT